MRYQNIVLGDLLKALPRRRFATIVERHKGDKYIKGFSSWDHLVTLISAQLGACRACAKCRRCGMHKRHTITTWGPG